jgi:hypothetical protein
MSVEHLHSWTIASAHHTSNGLVTYYRCQCGRHRVTHHPYSDPTDRRVGATAETYPLEGLDGEQSAPTTIIAAWTSSQ